MRAGKPFQTAFTKRLQLEYETWIRPSSDVVEEKLKTLREKIIACMDDNERLKLQVDLEDQEYKFRRYCLGILRLMGEMCGIRMLTRERLMICIEELLEYKSDEKLEYMCVLLTTAGHLMGEYSERMDIIFKKINDIIRKSRLGEVMENGKKISSRIRYALQDVVDLRKRDWDQDIY